jgi:hypothetical protein
MNQPKKCQSFRFSPLILCGLLLAGSSSVRVEASARDLGIAGALLGGIAALGLACYACSETDERANKAGEAALKEGRVFSADVDAFRTIHNITHPETSPSSLVYYEDRELAIIAGQFVLNNTTANEYLGKLYDALSLLRYSKKNLSNRIEALERNYRSNDILTEMRSTHKRIKKMLPYLELYYEYLHTHRAFFDLHEYTYKVDVRYKQENLAYAQFMYDPIRFAYAIKQSVGSHTNLHGRYKLLAYKNMLDGDIFGLRSRLDALRYAYPTLQAKGGQWHDFLKRIRGTLLADPDYQYELREHEWQQEREEAIRLAAQEARREACEMAQALVRQQERAACEREREERARVKTDRVRQERQELADLRLQNAILTVENQACASRVATRVIIEPPVTNVLNVTLVTTTPETTTGSAAQTQATVVNDPQYEDTAPRCPFS